MAFRTCSTLTGSVSSVRPSRLDRRCTWVSTGRPGRSNATLRSTLAVLRPTPGNVTRSSIREGTTPSNRSTTAVAMPMRLRVLARKNPVDRISASTSSTGAAASEAASGKRANSAGRGQVDPLVRALGRQDRGRQQLEGIGMVEGAQVGGRPGEAGARVAGSSPAPDRLGCGVGPWAEDTGRFSRMEALELDVVASVDGPLRRPGARPRRAPRAPPPAAPASARSACACSTVRPWTPGSGPVLGVTARYAGRTALVGWAQVDGSGGRTDTDLGVLGAARSRRGRIRCRGRPGPRHLRRGR